MKLGQQPASDAKVTKRPAREAEMMRSLVQRHENILPLDTVE